MQTLSIQNIPPHLICSARVGKEITTIAKVAYANAMRRLSSGLHAVGTTDRQRAIRNADDAVSLMVRERDRELGCILSEYNDCDPRDTMECGHFIPREFEATRYHPWNVNAESRGCNSSHVSGYQPDKGFPYGLAIDAKYGEGIALFLYRLAHPRHERNAIPKDESWTTTELEQLKAAARMGARVYSACYAELRPHHFPSAP